MSGRHRAAAPPRQPVEREIPGADGYPVHGWAVLPDPAVHGSGPHPVLLNIHGGPYASHVGSFFDEAQVYAAAGYAVLMCNPRGSAGYGQAHGLAIKGRWGVSTPTTSLPSWMAAWPTRRCLWPPTPWA